MYIVGDWELRGVQYSMHRWDGKTEWCKDFILMRAFELRVHEEKSRYTIYTML